MDWGLAIQAGGAILDWFGGEQQKDAVQGQANAQAAEQQRVAQANRELSLLDAETARYTGLNRRFEADASAGLAYVNMQKLLAAQRTRFAKSGVVISKGSPVDIMEETTKAAAMDIMNIKYKGRSAKAEADSLAKRYELLAEKGLRDAAAQASLIQSAAADNVDAIDWNRWSSLAETAYEWFK